MSPVSTVRVCSAVLAAGYRAALREHGRRKNAAATYGPDDRCTVCHAHIAERHEPGCARLQQGR